MLKRASVGSVAEAYLELLAARGVEYFFANAGTDFAPIIEAFAKRAATGQPTPKPLTVPHEVAAVSMAHGFAMVTGRPQAVMVHVIVGAANAIGGIMNAAPRNAPSLFTARRGRALAGARGGRAGRGAPGGRPPAVPLSQAGRGAPRPGSGGGPPRGGARRAGGRAVPPAPDLPAGSPAPGRFRRPAVLGSR